MKFVFKALSKVRKMGLTGSVFYFYHPMSRIHLEFPPGWPGFGPGGSDPRMVMSAGPLLDGLPLDLPQAIATYSQPTPNQGKFLPVATE